MIFFSGYHFNTLSVQALVSAAVICYLGIFVVVRERYSPVSRAFLITTLTGVIWLFCFAFLYGSPDEAVALRWAKAAYFGVTLSPAAVYHFTTLVLLSYERDKRRVAAVWVVSVIFLLLNVSTDFLFEDLYRYSWGFYPSYSKTSGFFVVFFLAMILVVLRRFITEYRIAPAGSMRSLRAKSLFWFFVCAYISCLDFFAAYGIPLYPVGSFFILISTVFVARTVWRYRFIDVTPAFAAKTIVDTMSDALLIVDPEGFIRHSNRAAALLFGMLQRELEGRDATSVLPSAQLAGPLEAIFQSNDVRVFEVLYDGKAAGQRTLSVTASAVRDRAVRLIAVVFTVQDITERRKAEEQIRYLAYYDALTGLPNRTFYKEILNRAIVYAKRHRVIMATLFIDLDSFKRINDTLGHSAGDELLKATAQQLTKCVRKTDYVARFEEERMPDTVSRFGGDEFIVLLSEIRDGRDAARVARRIIDVLSKPFLVNGHEVFISASIGISLFPTDGEDIESLLKNADVAMYAAKEQGKAQYLFYAASMNTASQERLCLESELRRAIERGEFVVQYQPRYDIRNNTIVGMEALVRWNHTLRGLVSPREFISLAEETGLIVPLGEFVLRTACRQTADWMAEGRRAVPMAVNISARQFDHYFKEIVDRILAETGLPPGFLELEITESAIMLNSQKAIDMLQEWHAKGIRIVIDDFGTGYSSLSQLRGLPVSALKIDRSFIADIINDATIAKAVISMAHHLKLQVIAEGVETKDQLALLQSLGCDEVQGFFFGRPLPSPEMQAFLAAEYSIS